jgi:hypothetical protein
LIEDHAIRLPAGARGHDFEGALAGFGNRETPLENIDAFRAPTCNPAGPAACPETLNTGLRTSVISPSVTMVPVPRGRRAP